MASISALRDAIQGKLPATLHAYDVASGREQMRLPVGIVFPRPPRGGAHAVSGCTEMHEFVVEVHVGMAQGLPRAQDMLDSFISTSGTNSISTALETDKTLGAVVDTCVVDAFEAYNFGLLNGVDTLMARVPVTVWLDVS